MISERYRAQVDLLLQVLPYVAKQKIFALKGGTAINLFENDFPRLSVDIDLTYLPFKPREDALQDIQNGLRMIQQNLQSSIKDINVITVPLNKGSDVKLNCQTPNAQIKIEVNTVTRGHIFPVRFMPLSDTVQEKFGKFAAIHVISHAELYGGKICAALDRQHPRDLFDVKLLFDNEGFTDEVRHGSVIGFLSHYKPIHELIDPIVKDQKSAFDTQFAGMSTIAFSYEDYETTRQQLIETIKQSLTDKDKALIFSFENGEPDWSLFPEKAIKDLPAVQWKLQNIRWLAKNNPVKHKQLVLKLEEVLYGN